VGRCSGFFVAATDTGVGKTVVTAAMALALRERGQSVGVFKPVQSGFDRDDPDGDTMLLRRWLELDVMPESLNVAAYSRPLAPLVAARFAGEEIRLGPIVERSQQLSKQYDAVLVEGAGGLLVPVGETWTIADLAVALDYPLIIVARAALGTVNHTLLTVRVARSLGLRVAGVVLNASSEGGDASNASNHDLIAEFGDVDVLGPLPWLGDRIDGDAIENGLVPLLDAARLDALAESAR